MKERPVRKIETHDIVWAGITIRVSYERDWLGSAVCLPLRRP